MSTDEVEAVLANWIEQALSPLGRLPEGATPEGWIATQFSRWWRKRAGDTMADAERAASSVVEELTQLGGWESFGEALHEMIHLRDALGNLRGLMRLPEEADA